MSFQTGTLCETIYNNANDFTEQNTFTSEASLLTGVNEQPMIPSGFFLVAPFRRKIRIHAAGYLSTTATPTFQIIARLNSTAGSANLAGTVVGKTAAITCSSGVSSIIWTFDLTLTCRTPGIGASNTTLFGTGLAASPAGFATPFAYAISPGGGDSATLTSTIDGSVTQWLNLSAVCGTSSSSNKICCKELHVEGMN